METEINIGNGISTGANTINSPSINETTGNINNFGNNSASNLNPNINSPESIFNQPLDNLYSFRAFVPTVFEKAPAEFGKTDSFKDTRLITENSDSTDKSIREFDFSEFEKLIADLPISETKAENFNFNEFSIIANSYNKNSVENTLTDISDSEYDFEEEFEEIFGMEFQTDDSNTNIEADLNSTDIDDDYDYFQDLTIEDIESKQKNNNDLTEIQAADEPIYINNEEYKDLDPIQESDEDRFDKNITITSPESYEKSEAQAEPNAKNEEEINPSRDQNSEEFDEENEAKENHYDQEEQDDQEEEKDIKDEKQKNKKLLFVVDDAANQARINDANEAIDKLKSSNTEITGQNIVLQMGLKPDSDEISQIAKGKNKDGSYSESIVNISYKEFDDALEAKNEIENIFKSKTAVKVDQKGMEVDKSAIERVLQENIISNEHVLLETA